MSAWLEYILSPDGYIPREISCSQRKRPSSAERRGPLCAINFGFLVPDVQSLGGDETSVTCNRANEIVSIGEVFQREPRADR